MKGKDTIKTEPLTKDQTFNLCPKCYPGRKNPLCVDPARPGEAFCEYCGWYPYPYRDK